MRMEGMEGFTGGVGVDGEDVIGGDGGRGKWKKREFIQGSKRHMNVTGRRPILVWDVTAEARTATNTNG